jgi:phage/plasmid-like protein (TIGR03299 family)
MTAFAITNNLDWTVSNRAVASMNFKGEWEVDPSTVAVHRDDNDYRLGYVSKGYESVQNEVLLSKVNPLIEEGILTVENMGHLQNGAKVFIQARISQGFQVIGEDYNAFITLLNGHTANASVAIGSSAVRVICANTFTMAYRDIGQKFRHNRGVNELVIGSSMVMDLVNEDMARYAQNVETIANATCTGAQFTRFLEATYNKKEGDKIRNIDRLNHLFYNGKGNEGHTLYDALNSVTEFSSHEVRKTNDGCFNYSNFGQGVSVNQRAMQVALEMAAV